MDMKKIFLISILLSFYSLHSFGNDSIESYFNHRQDVSYVDPYYGRSRTGDDLEKVIITAINSAKNTIDIAVYDFDLPKVAEALVAKAKSGVRVRLVLENLNSRPFKELTPLEISELSEHDLGKYKEFVAFADTNGDLDLSPDEISKADALTILKDGNINWIDDTADGSKGSGLMHHKFIVIDSGVIVTGSTNFTRSCVHGDFNKPKSQGNANSLLKIHSISLAKLFLQEFEEMFINKKFGLRKSFRGEKSLEVDGTKIKIQFSPTSKTRGYEASTNGMISRTIKNGSSSAQIALFVFSEQKIADDLKIARSNGLVPNVLIDPSFATRYYSELLDLWGLQMRNTKCAFEKGNQPWSPGLKNSGFTPLEDGDVLHHKFAVVDAKAVIVGSHNWSLAANEQNDEATLIIENTKLAQKFEKEFSYLVDNSVIGPQAWLFKKIEKLDINCGQLD